VLTGIADSHLGGQEQVLARDPGVGHGGADSFFVAIGLRGVDRAVADLDGLADAALAFSRVDPLDAAAQDGHLDAIVQRDVLHGLPLWAG
jgi:hypothetical protein